MTATAQQEQGQETAASLAQQELGNAAAQWAHKVGTPAAQTRCIPGTGDCSKQTVDFYIGSTGECRVQDLVTATGQTL